MKSNAKKQNIHSQSGKISLIKHHANPSKFLKISKGKNFNIRYAILSSAREDMKRLPNSMDYVQTWATLEKIDAY